MRRSKCAGIVVVFLVAATTLYAHEFWVSPVSWQVEPGGRATILANVGDRFPDATSFTAPDRVESIRFVGPGTDSIVQPPFRREKSSLAADVLAPSTPGTYMGVVVIKPRMIEIKALDFERYLSGEGLKDVVKYRAEHGETQKAGRERYSRYGKTLLRVGHGGDGAVVTRPLGLKAELVPLVDPTSLKPGARLRVRLLLEGQPVTGAMIGAIYASAKSGPDEWPLTAQTDARGEAEFTLDEPGPWLIRSVRMVRRDGERGAQAADWESYWTSLSFQLASP